MEVELARLSDATALVSLRDDIARWLTARDIAQWNPGEFSVDWLRSWIHDGCVHVAREPGGIVAAVAVVWDDAEIWGPDPTASAGYVHLLMVDRHRAGRGLGDVMLARAEDRITRAGRRLARLDAVATNEVLLDWYRHRGYREVGREAFDDDHWHDTILMEKELPLPHTGPRHD